MTDTSNPYAAPIATIAESSTAFPARKAERTSRLLAKLSDGLLSLVAWIPLLIGIVLLGQQTKVAGGVFILVGVLALIALLAVQITLLVRYSQTLGKRWQGIRIVRVDGQPIGFGRILGLRIVAPTVLGAIPLIGGVFSLANILWIFGEEKRCLHDYFADTIVVNV